MAMKPFIWKQPLGREECPYAYRWVLWLGRFGSIRLHKWLRSDDKRAKHDHPSDFLTLVLWGGYTDLGRKNECKTCNLKQPTCKDCHFEEHLTRGNIRRRSAEHVHTVDVDAGGCWTLLYFWPERRTWGFWIAGKNGRIKFKAARRYFASAGHHPCDQD